MKIQISLLLALFSILVSGCGESIPVKYKPYTSQDKAYTIEVPEDFSLMHNDVGGFMSFERRSSNSSDAAFITIEPTTTGFAPFEKSINASPKFQYSIYKNTDNARFAECVKGMWSAVELAMIKEVGGTQYLISLNAQVSRSKSEAIIQHLYESMTEGVPSEITEDSSDAIETTKEESPKFKTYSNPYFSISYPRSWISIAKPDAMSDVYLGAPDESLGFTVVRFDTDYSLAEIVAEAKSGAQQGGMKVTSSKDITLNGLNGNRIVNEFNYQGMAIKTVAYTFKKGETMFSVKFGTQKTYVDANAELMEEIMKTFKIK